LPVVNGLDGEDTGDVWCLEADIRHGRDQSVLLDVERARVEGPFVSECLEASRGKSPGQELAKGEDTDLYDEGVESQADV
jgi:hypothetical protein